MILSYATHKMWSIIEGKVNMIVTNSPIAYRDIVQGFKEQNDLLRCNNDTYDSLQLNKVFDFVGDPVLSGDVTKKYLLQIVKNYISDLDEATRNKILTAYHNLEVAIQDSLFLENIPLEITFEEDIKKLLKILNLHLDYKIISEPYGIIETVLNINKNCRLKTIPVFCNVANYLDKQEFSELNEIVKQKSSTLILIEFGTPQSLVVPDDVVVNYIDEDLVDWY